MPVFLYLIPLSRLLWVLMRILLSNDDGYFAPGIACLADALREIAEVTVVAPERDRSGASNSLTLAHWL